MEGCCAPHPDAFVYAGQAGMYMDVAEQLVANHLRKDDLMSALITGEWWVAKQKFVLACAVTAARDETEAQFERISRAA